MKTGILWIFGVLTAVVGNHVQASAPLYSAPAGIVVEFRPSYFYPTSADFRDLFGHGGANYQLTSTIPLYNGTDLWARGINLWLAVDYFSKHGHSSLGNEVGIRIVPLTLGLKYFLPSTGGHVPINFYGAAGMKYYFVHTHNNASQVQNTINQRGMGGVIEAGFIASINENLFLDVFSTYSIKSFRPPSLSNPAVEAKGLDVSGFNIGAGVGYGF